MNGSKSPAPPVNGVAGANTADSLFSTRDGQRSPEPGRRPADDRKSRSPPQQQQKRKQENIYPSGGSADTKIRPIASASTESMPITNREAADDDAASEAETLISSPVKKREVERQNSTSSVIKVEPSPHQQQRVSAPRHRIGSLPVPTDNDDEADSTASPVTSTEVDATKSKQIVAKSGPSTKDVDMDDRANEDVGSQDEIDDNDSDSLSSIRSDPPSRASSRSRAGSEQRDYAHQGIHSPNPRKRKHRASSVNLPNKRSSVEVQKQRRLRDLHSEEFASRSELSPSPKLRSHRRAVSTQSAFMDGASEHHSRKRRGVAQGLGRESKTMKNGWEESDASSETTSHGQAETRRPTRGIGRSTSTPGRPPGREHKRHVNKYGFTRLAEACETGDLDLVKEWRDKDPDQLELAEFAGNKPLQIAALNGNVEVVDYLIDQGCQIDCANVDKDTPLIDAAENGHLDVVRSLLKAGVDPLRQNLKGQQALDVVTDETDDADQIRIVLRNAIDQWNSDGAKQRREEEEEQRHRAGPTKELHFMARTYENLLKLVQNNDRTGVREFLDARVPVDNAIITAAARTGDSYLVNMLLAEMTEKKAFQKPEKPMLGVLGTSHYEMVVSLTQLEQFNPLFRNRQGLSWVEIAEQRNGPNVRQEVELLQRLHDKSIASKQRRSSSPVAKRDNGKRRLAQTEDDDSDDDEAPKRKNGRRLMSKKDMRAASGKAVSESSSEESGSEIALGTEGGTERSMKPPESPQTKRGSGRPRANSVSIQSSTSSPGLRRRSSSLRADQPLATVPEKTETQEVTKDSESKDEERSADEKLLTLEEERRQDQQNEAATNKALEEEAARQAEEDRKADEIRLQEEERRAEEARKVEQERKRVEAEMAEAKRVHREGIIASLPSAAAHTLDPQSSFDYHSDMAPNFLIYHFTPLQVIRHERCDASAEASFWVINVQAAPLIGQRGMELLIRPDIPGWQDSLAKSWETKTVAKEDMTKVDMVLANRLDDPQLDNPMKDESGLPKPSFKEQAWRRWSDYHKAKERVRNGEVALRLVRLEDVLDNLHPALRSVQIEVRFDHLTSSSSISDGKDQSSFVDRIGGLLGKRFQPRIYVDGKLRSSGSMVMGTTMATIIEEK